MRRAVCRRRPSFSLKFCYGPSRPWCLNTLNRTVTVDYQVPRVDPNGTIRHFPAISHSAWLAVGTYGPLHRLYVASAVPFIVASGLAAPRTCVRSPCFRQRMYYRRKMYCTAGISVRQQQQQQPDLQSETADIDARPQHCLLAEKKSCNERLGTISVP